MSEKLYMHYVCTHKEAEKFIQQRENFWVSNCGCRESGAGCHQSRIDVCLMFSEEQGSSGSNMHAITKTEALDILHHAKEKKLVARPFRNEDFTDTDGICFCCQDCCGYFQSPDEICNKGAFIEKTDITSCVHCGACEEVCYFNARKIQNNSLLIEREACYGCGLCVDVCPVKCIQMEIVAN